MVGVQIKCLVLEHLKYEHRSFIVRECANHNLESCLHLVWHFKDLNLILVDCRYKNVF